MIGSVLVRMQAYMKETLGESEWKELLKKAGLPEDKIYRTISFYPEDELDRLMDVACEKIAIDRDVLFKKLGFDFGMYVLETYKMMFFSSWGALEVIEKAAPKVYKSIQYVDLRAPKTSFESERISPDEVIVRYRSARKNCAYILGIIDAVGEHFNEKLEVYHTRCQKNKSDECEIHVKLVKSRRFLHAKS